MVLAMRSAHRTAPFDERTVFVSNIHELVTPAILEELFIQVSPVEDVFLSEGANRYALVALDDEDSVHFACDMLDGIRLYGLPLEVRPKAGTNQLHTYNRKEEKSEEEEVDIGSMVSNTNGNNNKHVELIDQEVSDEDIIVIDDTDPFVPSLPPSIGANPTYIDSRGVFRPLLHDNNAIYRRIPVILHPVDLYRDSYSFHRPTVPNFFDPNIGHFIVGRGEARGSGQPLRRGHNASGGHRPFAY